MDINGWRWSGASNWWLCKIHKLKQKNRTYIFEATAYSNLREQKLAKYPHGKRTNQAIEVLNKLPLGVHWRIKIDPGKKNEKGHEKKMTTKFYYKDKNDEIEL